MIQTIHAVTKVVNYHHGAGGTWQTAECGGNLKHPALINPLVQKILPCLSMVNKLT